MQTFITSTADDPQRAIVETFDMLDQSRLGKQRVEAYQILLAFEEHTKKSPTKYTHWLSSPAVRMWEGHLPALTVYGAINCMRWRKLGHDDTLLGQFQLRRRVYLANDPDAVVWPWWFGHPAMVRTHQAKLYYKMSPRWVEAYSEGNIGKSMAGLPPMKLPYLWPDPHEDGLFRISNSELKNGDWEIPSSWSFDQATRVVIPR